MPAQSTVHSSVLILAAWSSASLQLQEGKKIFCTDHHLFNILRDGKTPLCSRTKSEKWWNFKLFLAPPVFQVKSRGNCSSTHYRWKVKGFTNSKSLDCAHLQYLLLRMLSVLFVIMLAKSYGDDLRWMLVGNRRLGQDCKVLLVCHVSHYSVLMIKWRSMH